ncbi:MAG: T9SS type A sorting domain-containing protein [Elusimicrobia bacterium]|nr:T9SS type A sorting domain-containing protein [Elusimicrobiota bacterium]
MGETNKYLVAVFSAVCVPAACCRLSAAIILTGGTFSVPVISSLSGGGTASGGALVMKAANMGGPTASGARLSGGDFTITGGATPAVITLETARPDLGAAHCYPVPFKPSAGHTTITFTGLTSSARVRIYTISGELVRTLDKSDAGDFLEWNVKNARGEAVVSGVYLYVVKSASQTRTGKLMIIR